MSSSSSLLQYLSSNSTSQNDSQNRNDNNQQYTDHNENNNPMVINLNRQLIVFDDDWMKKSGKSQSKSIQLNDQGEAKLLEIEREETELLQSNQHHVISPNHNKTEHTKKENQQQSKNTEIMSPDELDENPNVNSNKNHSSKQQIRAKPNVIPSPIRTSTLRVNRETNAENRKSKIPLTTKSHSPTKSLSSNQFMNKRQSSSLTNTGAFHFVTSNDQKPMKNRSKTVSLSKNNSSLVKDERKRIASSDEEDTETDTLSQNDLKVKLKEEKRTGKKRKELLNKLHENYEELLEKYAQAENTIDQLRFQPKPFNDTTPRSTTSEHHIHFIQQPATNVTNLRSSGVYHSTNGSPFSVIKPLTSTTTTPVRKSISPAFSEELITQETQKVSFLIQTKTLGNKMKSFLTLMNTDQLSLAEQQQVYENIKQDYEKLVRTLDRKKHDEDFRNIDLDGDINTELDSMKDLLQEIVQRITNNLLGKSNENSPNDQCTKLTLDVSHSGPASGRSSLCNHNELIDQYRRLLNAVNTDSVDQKMFGMNELENDAKQTKTSVHDSSRLSLYDRQTPSKSKQKPYVYVSGDSEEEEQHSQTITPIPTVKKINTTTYEPEYIAPSSVKRHEYVVEDEIYKRGQSPSTKKQTSNNRQDNKDFDKAAKSKRRIKPEQKKINNDHQYMKQSSPLMPSDSIRYLNSSLKTRVNDYDSGIGTTNMTKLSHDSKLYQSTMDESHFHSFDEEQESISSSNSSNSDFVGSGSPYRFNNSLSNRRKSQGHYDPYSSDIHTRATGSFDPFPTISSINKRMHRSDHTWRPQRISTHHRARLIPLHRSTSSGRHEIESSRTKYAHAFISPKRITDKSIYYHEILPSSNSRKIYRSSIYIDRPNTYGLSQEPIKKNQCNGLYVDTKTGVVYRYESKKKSSPPTVYCELPSQEKLYHCTECGIMTNHHHRHHFNSTVKRTISRAEDLGYDSGYGERSKWDRFNDNISSSDTDSDTIPYNHDTSSLDEVYDRAEKVLYDAQNLSRHINRQLKLTLATI